MATFETIRPAPFGAETVYRLVSFVDTMRATLVNWNNTRVTRNAISKLTDRELADIGLSRSDVENMSFHG